MKIALLGFGTVGKGVYDILKADFKDIEVKYVLVKHQEKHQDIKDILVADFNTILYDDSIDIVIETIGNMDIAYDYITKSLNHKKHVITANKALVSKYFEELIKLAKQNDVMFRFEASVGAGLNIIDPLYTISKINHIHKIEGIINGSTNFILSKIFLEDYLLEQALKEAQSLGYIEADPKDDLEGFDLMRKIHILSMIAYQASIDPNQIIIKSLRDLTQKDIDEVKKKNQVIKYVASSKKIDDQIFIKVEPVILDKNHIFANVNGVDNIIVLYGKYHEKQIFIGQGAGRYPTASAIIYDILKVLASCSL
jgi:homoserine dehydrogenase